MPQNKNLHRSRCGNPRVASVRASGLVVSRILALEASQFFRAFQWPRPALLLFLFLNLVSILLPSCYIFFIYTVLLVSTQMPPCISPAIVWATNSAHNIKTRQRLNFASPWEPAWDSPQPTLQVSLNSTLRKPE